MWCPSPPGGGGGEPSFGDSPPRGCGGGGASSLGGGWTWGGGGGGSIPVCTPPPVRHPSPPLFTPHLQRIIPCHRLDVWEPHQLSAEALPFRRGLHWVCSACWTNLRMPFQSRAGGAIRTLTLFFLYYGIHSLMFGGYPPTAIGYPPTAIGYTLTAIGYPPAAIGYPSTAIGYPSTAIGYPPAAIVGRIGHSEFFFFSLRHPLVPRGIATWASSAPRWRARPRADALVL